MIKRAFTSDSYFTMATSSTKDARTIMALFFACVCGVLALLGGGVCDATTELSSNQNENLTLTFINNNNNNNFSEPVISIKNTTKLFPGRYARFLTTGITQNHLAPLKSVDDNEIDDKDDKEADDPTAPLYGIYYDCFFRLSFQCVQRKLLVFLDRLSRLKSFSVIGDMISVVRNKKDLGPVIKEAELEARLNPGEASSALSALLEYNLERFLQNHVLRVTLPSGVTASVSGNARSSGSLSGNTIDINITRVLEETTGRGKGDKKMKKLMGMLMTGLMGKMAFMGPFMVLMIKMKALKALILSKIALMLSLFHLFKGGGKKGGGGGHGKEVIIVHDTHGGGGHEALSSSAWASGGGGWSGGGGGGGGGWLGGGDSYASGIHTGGGDATYSGSDAYSTGTHGGGGWGGGSGSGNAGWGRRSSSTDPHWVAYRAYIPDAEE